MIDRYSPCPTGIHVCGSSADGLDAVTVDNMPTRSRQRARAAWRAIKGEFDEVPAPECDVVLDLMEGGDCEQTFGARRQWLARIKQIVEAQNA